MHPQSCGATRATLEKTITSDEQRGSRKEIPSATIRKVRTSRETFAELHNAFIDHMINIPSHQITHTQSSLVDRHWSGDGKLAFQILAIPAPQPGEACPGVAVSFAARCRMRPTARPSSTLCLPDSPGRRSLLLVRLSSTRSSSRRRSIEYFTQQRLGRLHVICISTE